MWNEY